MGFHTEKLTRRMSVNWAVRFGQCACPVALWLQQQYHLNTLTVKSTKNKKDNMAQPPPPYSEAFLDCGCDNLLGKEKDCITTLGYFEKFNRTEKKAWLARKYTFRKYTFKNTLSENTLSENTLSENTLSVNTISENTLVDNTLSEYTLSENTISKNTLSENTLSKKTLSENTLSKNTLLENTLSENTLRI